MFVLPWGDFSYVGTTDTDFRGSPADVRADETDVRYLLESANSIFPAARLTAEDVVSTWAGLRPLLAPLDTEGGRSESATSREHEIWQDRSGLLNIAGGKLTTYRVMAAEVADEAARILQERHGVASGSSLTEDLPLPAAPTEPWDDFAGRIRQESAAVGLDEAAATHLARFYGDEAGAVLDEIRLEPELGTRLIPSLPYLRAEIARAVRCEMAMTLEDLLVRRLHIFYEARDGGLSVAREVAERMAAEPGIGWSAAEIERQVERYRRAVEETRGFGAA
jgi:glycerol-3-phosphate dehydrogenase